MKLSEPWPEPYKVNARSPFGWRVHPISGKRKFHHGVDVACPTGTPLTAPADGTIVHKGAGASGGYTLIVKHAPDLFTVYYHLREPSHLNKGTKVQRGERIAWSGNTGASTGPHLHFEVRHPTRTWGQTVDPMPYFEPEPKIIIEEPVTVEKLIEELEKPVPPRVVKPMSARLRRFFDIRRALR